MARGKKDEITPRYDLMLDSYVNKAKTALEEHKKVMILYYQSMWIGDDGSLYMLHGDYYTRRVKETEAALSNAVMELETFKNTCGDKILELKQSKELT